MQDTLSSRAALGLPAFRPSPNASREQKYRAYKYIILFLARALGQAREMR